MRNPTPSDTRAMPSVIAVGHERHGDGLDRRPSDTPGSRHGTATTRSGTRRNLYIHAIRPSDVAGNGRVRGWGSAGKTKIRTHYGAPASSSKYSCCCASTGLNAPNHQKASIARCLTNLHVAHFHLGSSLVTHARHDIYGHLELSLPVQV